MQIINIILLMISAILGGIAICDYYSLRRLLNLNKDKTVDDISDNIQPRIKRLSFILYALATVYGLYLILLIIEFVLVILKSA